MNWNEYYFSMLPIVASKSKDQSTKVAAIIVGPSNEIRSTGFNSFPRGINDNLPDRQQRPKKYLYFEHAERNAIYNAARVGISLEGCKIYLDFFPCSDCARAIIQAGIKEIVIDGRDYDNKLKYWNERWKDHMEGSREMLSEAGVSITIYRQEETR